MLVFLDCNVLVIIFIKPRKENRQQSKAKHYNYHFLGTYKCKKQQPEVLSEMEANNMGRELEFGLKCGKLIKKKTNK